MLVGQLVADSSDGYRLYLRCSYFGRVSEFLWISCILFGLGFCNVFACFPNVASLDENPSFLAKMLLQFLCSVPLLLQRHGCCAADRSCRDQWRYRWWKSHRCHWDLMIETNRKVKLRTSQKFLHLRLVNYIYIYIHSDIVEWELDGVKDRGCWMQVIGVDDKVHIL